MIERLEALARQCSLRFSNHGGTEVNLSADMFLIQILMEVSGRVKDVRITHSGDTQVGCINCADFAKDFATM